MYPTELSQESGNHPTIPTRWAYPIREAAEILGLSRPAVMNLIDSNQITYVQGGPRQKRLIEGNELLRWLKEHRVERKAGS